MRLSELILGGNGKYIKFQSMNGKIILQRSPLHGKDSIEGALREFVSERNTKIKQLKREIKAAFVLAKQEELKPVPKIVYMWKCFIPQNSYSIAFGLAKLIDHGNGFYSPAPDSEVTFQAGPISGPFEALGLFETKELALANLTAKQKQAIDNYFSGVIDNG